VIHHIKPVTGEAESEPAREIYRQIKREFGVLGQPPMPDSRREDLS